MRGLPVRLIAADRPGSGLSDPHPGALLRDRAADIVALADAYGLSRFALVGVSGGGPAAAACARFFPDRVAALTLISAVPPPDRGVGTGLRLLMRLGRRPALGAPAIALVRGLVRSSWGEACVFGGTLPAMDAVVLTAERRAGLLAAMREGLRPGGAGALADAGLYGRRWGFDTAQIAVSTTVWHGTEDRLVDVANAAAYATIPGVRMNILPGHGHYSLALGQTAAIMAELLDRAAITT